MTDVTIVGSGIAGLFVAIRCARAGLKVALVTKKNLADSSTNYAQGGIAGILDPLDEKGLEAHIQDTLAAGDGLCDERIVRMVVQEAGARINDLVQEGVRFDQSKSGDFDLVMEGGHQERRILHSKDATGAEIERALIQSCISEPKISIHEGCLAVDLILANKESAHRRVVGLWCLGSDGSMFTLRSRATLLATGGAGRLWRDTTNPSVATGDGIAMAVRAGAAVRDLEFVQFHPTALAVPGDRPFLITEAVRGEGGVLMNASGLSEWRAARKKEADLCPEKFSFMSKADPRGSLATRDIVARACDAEMMRTGARNVLLITEHLDERHLQERFPTISNRLASHGLRLGIDPIPVAPAAHYMVGGLAVTEDGEVLQSNLQGTRFEYDSEGRLIQGLFAMGEVACTGLHGANRLASNSLLEAVVFSHRAGTRVIEWLESDDYSAGQLPEWRAEGLHDLIEHAPLVSDEEGLRNTMSIDVGLVKSDRRLARAKRRLDHLFDEVDRMWRDSIPTHELVELRNMTIVARLVTKASIHREKNVGLHYNVDRT